MLFSHSDPGDRELNLLGQKIIRVHQKGKEQYFKLVRILLDEKLTWKYHIDKVKTKIAQSTALICRSKRYLPKAVKYYSIEHLWFHILSTVWRFGVEQLSHLHVNSFLHRKRPSGLQDAPPITPTQTLYLHKQNR
jgi:hypothetical protein